MKRIALAVLAAAAVFAVGMGVQASIPDADGTINGCYRPDGPAQGNLVVVDSEESCPSGYTALDWSQGGLANYEIVVDENVSTNVGTPIFTVDCPAGTSVLGGGVYWDGLGTLSIANARMVASYPEIDASGWTVVYYSSSVSTIDLYAVCATV